MRGLRRSIVGSRHACAALGLVLLLSGTMLQASPSRQPDSCSELLPKALRSAIAKSYPDSRVVRESDYDAGTIASEQQYHRGSACLGIAAADVNGDGRKD